MSVKMLSSAVQRHFEMEILLRRSELGAVERCEHEADDTISTDSFPHAYCQPNLTFNLPNSKHLHTGANVCTHTDLITDTQNTRSVTTHVDMPTAKPRGEEPTSNLFKQLL